MPDIFFIIAVPILALMISFISTRGTLTDLKYKKRWWKIITERGWYVILLTVIIAGLLVWQNHLNNKKEITKDDLLKRQRAVSDSTISSKVDSNRKVLFNDLSEALAKQNLILDTVTKNLKSLRDSAKTVIVNTPKDQSIIIVKADGISHSITSDTIEFTVNLVSTQASSTLLFLDYLVELNYQDGSKASTKRSNLLKGKIPMPKDQPLNKPFWVTATKPVTIVNIALIGKYISEGSKKETMLAEVYEYSLLTKKTGFFLEGDKLEFFQRYFIR